MSPQQFRAPTISAIAALVIMAFSGVAQAYQFEVLWRLAPYDRPYLTVNNTPPIGQNDLPYERGLGYNPVTHRLLLISRAPNNVGIYVLDAETGADLYKLKTNGVSGGQYDMSLIQVADDGVVYAANLATSSGQTFKIYRWANDSSNTTATVAFSGNPNPSTSDRWGDTFAVRGAGTNTQILIAPRSGTNVVIFTTANGTSFTAHTIKVPDTPAADCGLAVSFGVGNTFWGTSKTNPLRQVTFNLATGTGVTTRLYNEPDIPNAVCPLGISTNLNLLGGIYINSPAHLRIYDLTLTNGTPVLVASNNFATDNSNVHTAAGAVDFSSNIIYALEAQNGLMAIRIRPSAQLQMPIIQAGRQIIVQGSAAPGNYWVDATSTPFTNWLPVTNLSFTSNSTFEFTDALTNASQRFYRIRQP